LVNPSAALAKYGIHADAALESQLHAILVSAACRRQNICIILDQIDTMMPPRLSGKSAVGDSTIPVLNAMASYLRKITISLQRHREWPFPAKNPFYNPTTYKNCCSSVLTVNVCLVGIVTCPDDGWRTFKNKNHGFSDAGSTILNCMGGDRYRIPVLNARTILSAFHSAFSRESVELDESAKRKLSTIKNILFEKNSLSGKTSTNVATAYDLEEAIVLAKINWTINSRSELKSGLIKKNEKSMFESIGGNDQAKISLEDALGFDPLKSEVLSRFGLSPPTGVLLYGPPGCGKTMLARAVAKMLNPNSGEPGGTFLSLSISEIISAEVGTSERKIVSSFEFAEKNAPSNSRRYLQKEIAVVVN